MIESTSAKVLPDEEQKVVKEYEQFGWVLKSNQEVKSENSHLENRRGDLYSVTEKTHYINLLFQRDTKMENYNELKRLETEYWSIVNSRPSYPTLMPWIIAAIIGLIIYVVPGLVVIAIRIYIGIKNNKDWDMYREKAKRLPEIQDECCELLTA